MPIFGVKDFNKDRLVQAKNARGLTSVGLSGIVNISQSSISLYEKANKNRSKK